MRDDEDEAAYRRYVDRKWNRGESARMPDEHKKARDAWSKSKEFGDLFRDGMCEILGRTEKKGWNKEQYYVTDLGKRFHDAANKRLRHVMEFKAGKVGQDALLQLEKDVRALRAGYTVEWFTVTGAWIDPSVAAKMAELREKYPSQFKTVEVTKEQFAQAIEAGQAIARQRQDQARVQDMGRVLEHGKDLDAVRQTVREDIIAQAEIVTAAREQGLEFDYEGIRTAHAELTAALEQVRERERQNSRDMMAAAGRTPEQIEILAPMLEENRDARRRDLTAHLTTIEHEVRRQDWRREVAPHNEIAQQMGIKHVRQAEQQPRGYPIEHQSRVLTAQRDAERLIFTPEQVAELDIEKFRAVRDGERLGYDPAEKVHIYQRGEEPPVKVAHEDRERRLAEIAKNVREGLSVEEVIARNRNDLTFSTPIEEARLAPLSKEPPALTTSRDRGQELDRGLSRDR